MTHEEITRWPLTWPHGRPRCEVRKYGHFTAKAQSAGTAYAYQRKVTLSEALKRVFKQLEMIGAEDVVVSTNLKVRIDGLPRSDQRKPDDPGVAIYFKVNGDPVCLPCDRYTDLEQNVAAIAAHIEATRAIERHGVASLKEMFTSFTALPAPGQIVARDWRSVLGVGPLERSMSVIINAYRVKRSEYHPDKPGGSADAFDQVKRAYMQAEAELIPTNRA